MRELTVSEIDCVTGGVGSCTPANTSGNSFGGVRNTPSLGQDLVNIYEGLVFFTSHVIERVAKSRR